MISSDVNRKKSCQSSNPSQVQKLLLGESMLLPHTFWRTFHPTILSIQLLKSLTDLSVTQFTGGDSFAKCYKS